MTAISRYSASPVVARVLERLQGVVRAQDGWMARCPAHKDRTPSLSVSEGKDGRALLHCFAGCTLGAVVAAAGLSLDDLFPPKDGASFNGNGHHGNGNGRKPDPDPSQRDAMVATYAYLDADGTLLYEACRFRKVDGGKKFLQRRPDPEKPGEWLWQLGEQRLVPYRLPELIEGVALGKTVYVVEGEKDADRLVSLGHVATTNPMGAGKWRDTFAPHFRGAGVVVLADNDDPGRAHAETVAGSVLAAGAAWAKVVELPALPPKGDVSDWLDAGNTSEELLLVVERTRRWHPDPVRRALWRLDELLDNDEIMRPPLPVVPRLAWKARSTLLAMGEKGGKSTLTGYLAAQVSTGGHFLGDPCEQGDVLIVGLEEFIGDAGRRLERFGAEPTRVYLLDRLPGDPRERPQVVKAAIECVSPKLVVIDTLMAYGEGQITDANSSAQMQAVVQQLTRLAHECEVALILVHHARKSDGTYRDSSAIGGAVDIIVELFREEAKDGQDADPRVRIAKARGRVPVKGFAMRFIDDATPPRYELVDAEALASARPATPDERVLHYVRTNPGCSTQRVIDGVGGRSAEIHSVLTRLLADGRLRNVGRDDRRKLVVPDTADLDLDSEG